MSQKFIGATAEYIHLPIWDVKMYNAVIMIAGIIYSCWPQYSIQMNSFSIMEVLTGTMVGTCHISDKFFIGFYLFILLDRAFCVFN